MNLFGSVVGVITVLSIVASAVWIVNQKINDNVISVHKLTISQLEKEINKKSNSEIFISEAEKNKLSPELKDKLIEAEKTKNEILGKIVLKSMEVLDPSSEIKELADLLNSTDEEDRQKAITGFFEIKNPSTSLYLSEYFFSYQDEATKAHNPSIREWIWLFEKFGSEEGILFCINLMKEGDFFNSKVGYESLNEKVLGGEDISKFENELKSIALMSEDTLKRTWAKKILNNKKKINEDPSAKADTRSMFRVLLDIEKLLLEKQNKK